MSMMYDGPVPPTANEMKPGKPRLRVHAGMSSFPEGGDKSWMKERHARLRKEIAATEHEITNWNAEAVAAQALKSIKADLARLKGDLLSCEAEMDEAGEDYGDGEDGEDMDEGDSEDSEDDSSAEGTKVAEGNPYSIYKRGGKYVIENNETGKVKGSHDSKKSAMKQFRLLEGIEHGWKPSEK